jgi:DUF1365 family protein
VPLDVAVRDLVAARTGTRPEGPVRLLTHLRYFGYGFNPVSFFYCFDRTGARVEAVVADVTSTPWGERHAYVLQRAVGDWRDGRGGEPSGGQGASAGMPAPVRRTHGTLRARCRKVLHVSPFLPMDLEHEFAISTPGERLAVRISDLRAGECVFDAALVLRRRAIDGRELARVLVTYPFMTARVIAGIYLQAYRLHRKGAPYFPHRRYEPALATCVAAPGE